MDKYVSFWIVYRIEILCVSFLWCICILTLPHPQNDAAGGNEWIPASVLGYIPATRRFQVEYRVTGSNVATNTEAIRMHVLFDVCYFE